MPDIKDLVKEHARRAFVLAQIEQRPPGYSTHEWAVLLMDSTREELEARYDLKVERERARWAEAVSKDPLFADRDFLPAVPATPPPALATKIQQVYDIWLGERVQLECENALYPLMGQKRSVAVLSQGVGLIREAIARLDASEGGVPFQAKLTMNKDGSFVVELTRTKNKRPGGV